MTLHVVKGIADLQSLKHSTLPSLQGIHNVLTVSAFNCALRSTMFKLTVRSQSVQFVLIVHLMFSQIILY